MADDIYEVFAITYARHDRNAAANFIGGDPHDGPMPLNYYVWVIRNAARTIVVDTGFDRRGAEKRGRELLRPLPEALEALGIDQASVADVVITHMHYDHCGNDGLFPNARFHLQDAEIAFATGRCMCHEQMRHAYELDDVLAMVRRVFHGRVCFHQGTSEPFPGIELHHVGGHARGLQSLRVKTGRGFVCLASDAAHHYAHLETRRVFPTCLRATTRSPASPARLLTSCRGTIPWWPASILRHCRVPRHGSCGSMRVPSAQAR
ncbi:MAG: beta-lactamase protein [Burkholderiales bacterium]|nr:beta-lactamase protein [Burkholderiales bacterium]